MRKKALIYFLFILVSVVVLKDILFVPGFPSTHDGQNHLARMANYYLALRGGQFPPRWAPNLEAGLGYTSLNFNYPLANILSIPFIALKINIQAILKLIFTASIFSSVFGMYFWLKTRYKKIPSAIGAIAYILAPYQLANIYIRGNIGESLSFALLPWVLYFGQQSLKSNKHFYRYIILFAFFLLSHNLIAVISIPLILLIFILTNKLSQIKKLIIPSFVSILSVSFFWIPALFEKAYIVLDSSPLSISQFYSHFVRLSQLFSSAWDHGYSYTFPVDGMVFSLGISGIIAAFLSIILLVKSKKYVFENVITIIFFITIFLMTVFSSQIWELIPALAIMQFPWRLLFFTTFLASISVANVSEKISWRVFSIILILSLFSLAKRGQGINYFSESNNYWFSFPLNTTIQNENDPIWYQRNNALEFIDKYQTNPIILNSSSSASFQKWSGSKHIYDVALDEDTTIIEKTIYFPGWETKINGQKVNVKNNAHRFFGLINFDIPAGTSHIETSFTQNTIPRIIGNLTSIIGIFWVLIIIKKSYGKKT